MTDRKIVMISSTAFDLPEHREQLRLACERAGFELREMTEHLTALEPPEPEMPTFDESAFEPLPGVEINPKDEYWVDPAALD